ncbi:MAG: ABC transporter permease [Candidatus Cloacimonadia bacterium]
METYRFFLKRFFQVQGKHDFFSLGSLITIAGIMIGVTALTVSLGIFSGYQDVLQETILGINAHVYILKFENQMISNNELVRISSLLDTLSGVAAYSPFVYTETMITPKQETYSVKTAESRVAGVVIRGINYEAEARTTNFQQFITEGEFVSDGNYVVIGSEIAQKLSVAVGDTLMLISPLTFNVSPLVITSRREPIAVSGIFDSGMFEYDNTFVYINLKAIQNFLEIGDNISGISVRLADDHIEQAAFYSEKISNILGYPFIVSNWIDMNGNLFSLLELEKWVIFIILALIVLVAGFGMFSMLTMHIIEKEREIGVLKAVGAPDTMIKRIFFARNVLLGLTGAFLGIILGSILSGLITETNLITLESDVYYIDKLVIKNNPVDFLYIILVAGVVIFVSAYFPLKRIKKLSPVNIIREIKRT